MHNHQLKGAEIMGKIITCVKCGKEFDTRISTFSVVLREGLYAKCTHCDHLNRLKPTAKDVDFRFGRVSLLPNPCDELSLRNASITKVLRTFSSNMDYVYSLGRLPEMILFQWAHRLRTYDSPLGDYRFPTGDNLVALRVMRSFMPSIDDLLANIAGDAVEMGIVSIFRAMILGTWAAFETFAGDLWETALNTHPKNLSDLGGNYLRIQLKAGKRLGFALPRPDSPKRTVAPVKMASCGTHHREHSGVKFDSLRAIRIAYSRAFKRRDAAVDNALSAPSLDILSNVRNLLMHRGGVVDGKYQSATKSIRGCPRGSPGNSLVLRGDRVEKLIKPVVLQSIALLKAVDAEVWK
jgi:DNA-directed RNA polymerase subunit RPC12/RpoP